ncbi:MAG: cytochrome c biogenesis protein CcsA [Planctomycetota bacterium]
MSFVVMLVVCVGGAFATAQVTPPSAAPGPAGNEHPESSAVGSTTELPSPFGPPVLDRAPMTVEEKAAFSRAVDLSPLAGLAVSHGGRVKIVDTLAGETVGMITGRGRYEDLILEEESDREIPAGVPEAAWRYSGDITGIEKVKFDPLFTWLDLMIDPAFYFDRPLIAVDYLPLRDAYLEAAFGGAEETKAARSLWKKSTRVSPRMVGALTDDIFARFGGSGPMRQGIESVENAERVFRLGAANLLLIAPNDRTDRWHHVSEWPAQSDVRLAASELGEAWRAADADRVNAAVVRLAETLPSINAELYPTTSRELELAYNRSDLFSWATWVYLLSLLALVLAFGTGRGWLRWTGGGLLVLAVAMHAAGFIARGLIAERVPIQNQFESMTGVALFAALVGLVLLLVRRQPLFGAASAGVGFLIMIAATEMPIPGESIEREAAILNTSVLLKYHVTTVLTSYGLITLGMIVSLFYLGAHYGEKLLGKSEMQVVAAGALGGQDAPAGGPTNARLLGDLDRAQMIVLQLAFWTLGVGILLGAWWADHSWGRWWAFDPKETWALITWIVYLIVIHARIGAGQRKGLLTAWLSVVGFIVMLWTYFGVNLLLPGLHAYA